MTYANILTLGRILLIVPFAILFCIPQVWSNWLAGGLYIFACATDYFDGLVARQTKTISPLGRVLDPIADKLLISTTLVLLASTRRIEGISLLPALVILSRELFISGLREYMASVRHPMAASVLAKWKTGVQMVSLSCLIIDDMRAHFQEFHDIGLSLLWVASFLSLITGYQYWKKAAPFLLDKNLKSSESE